MKRGKGIKKENRFKKVKVIKLRKVNQSKHQIKGKETKWKEKLINKKL